MLQFIEAKLFRKKLVNGVRKRWKYMSTPTYSPQLNIIEILWRFMKYEWLETKAYNCWKTLTSYVEHILRHFGDRYVINFA
jgi:transposase